MDDTILSWLHCGIHPGYTKIPDNINLIWKTGKWKKYYLQVKPNFFFFLIWHLHYHEKQWTKRNVYWPWFSNSSAIGWSRGRVAPESLPQFFYQAELKIHNHIQYCLRNKTQVQITFYPVPPTPNWTKFIAFFLHCGVEQRQLHISQVINNICLNMFDIHKLSNTVNGYAQTLE